MQCLAGDGEPVAEQQQPEQAGAGASPGTTYVNLASIGPLRLAVREVLPDGCEAGVVSVLLEVTPLRATPANTGCLSPVAGWPIRCAWSPFMDCS